MQRLSRIEEDMRTWAQGCAERLTHREMTEYRTLCDRIHVERLRAAEEVSELESSMGG